jgi:hypothetical protein
MAKIKTAPAIRKVSPGGSRGIGFFPRYWTKLYSKNPGSGVEEGSHKNGPVKVSTEAANVGRLDVRHPAKMAFPQSAAVT